MYADALTRQKHPTRLKYLAKKWRSYWFVPGENWQIAKHICIVVGGWHVLHFIFLVGRVNNRGKLIIGNVTNPLKVAAGWFTNSVLSMWCGAAVPVGTLIVKAYPAEQKTDGRMYIRVSVCVCPSALKILTLKESCSFKQHDWLWFWFKDWGYAGRPEYNLLISHGHQSFEFDLFSLSSSMREQEIRPKSLN